MAERRTAWFAVRSRRPGPTRAGIDEFLSGLGEFDPVLAELARATADLTDSAKRAQDPRLWLSASARLLTIRARLVGDRHDGRGDEDEAGGAGGVPDLAEFVGGSPEVRDPAAP